MVLTTLIEMFLKAASTDVDELVNTVTLYTSFCEAYKSRGQDLVQARHTLTKCEQSSKEELH